MTWSAKMQGVSRIKLSQLPVSGHLCSDCFYTFAFTSWSFDSSTSSLEVCEPFFMYLVIPCSEP